ncbi:MAG TPA: glutamate--tRNA ligase [Gemmatimonadota bacterium]|nr:glutamate--tRNA ligase [Gemmatimonadota bacterium]
MTSSLPRVRFAPSPTGYLHVGGARTALFNFLFARHEGGAFLLRIEDTDRARSSAEMTDQILSALDWLGLEVDEEPVHQADGVERHRAAAERLLEAGAAYRSFLTEDELAAAREAAREAGEPVRRERIGMADAADEAERMAAGEPYAVFFAVPGTGATQWDDVVHEETGVDNTSIDDFVVLRSDGTPVYNLAVVADDIEMGITHVIRGDDHLSNTPKQVLIYEALGATLPRFCHVPMILGPDGKRLSKRHGAASVEAFRESGILPEALVNFLALMGWSPGDDREVMMLDELIEAFSLDRILKKASVFDAEKLEWLNSRHMDAMPAGRLAPLLIDHLPEPERSAARDAPERLAAVVDLVRQRTRTIDTMAEQARPFFTPLDAFEFDEAAMRKHWKDVELTAERLRAVRELLAGATRFEAEPLEADLRELAERQGIGAGKLFQPLRVALVGTDRSPGIFDVILLLGRELAVARLDRALAELAIRCDPTAT